MSTAVLAASMIVRAEVLPLCECNSGRREETNTHVAHFGSERAFAASKQEAARTLLGVLSQLCKCQRSASEGKARRPTHHFELLLGELVLVRKGALVLAAFLGQVVAVARSRVIAIKRLCL